MFDNYPPPKQEKSVGWKIIVGSIAGILLGFGLCGIGGSINNDRAIGVMLIGAIITICSFLGLLIGVVVKIFD